MVILFFIVAIPSRCERTSSALEQCKMTVVNIYFQIARREGSEFSQHIEMVNI